MGKLLGPAVLIAALLAGGCYTSGTYASAGVVVGDPPAYTGGYYHRDGWVWVEGRWVWQDGQWHWHEGYWVPARPGYVYIQGTWDYGDHWYWRSGYWTPVRPGYVYARGGYWGYRDGRRVWIRGSWQRDRSGNHYRPGDHYRPSRSGRIRDHRSRPSHRSTPPRSPRRYNPRR